MMFNLCDNDDDDVVVVVLLSAAMYPQFTHGHKYVGLLPLSYRDWNADR